MHNKFVDLILAETKTLEIRNQFLRCVPEGGEFYLLRAFEKGAGRNLHGQTCLEIAAKLIFKGNHFISHDDFDSFYDKHRVPSNAYASMRKGWKSDKGGCVAWEIEVDSVINPPRYLPSGSQDWCWPSQVLQVMCPKLCACCFLLWCWPPYKCLALHRLEQLMFLSHGQRVQLQKCRRTCSCCSNPCPMGYIGFGM